MNFSSEDFGDMTRNELFPGHSGKIYYILPPLLSQRQTSTLISTAWKNEFCEKNFARAKLF